MSNNVYKPPSARLEPSDKQCSECGASISRKAEICPKCGVRQKGRVDKTALVLLTFFLGWMGAHKFYLRKPVQGILYALFFLTLIPSLIAFIEFIVYACTSEQRLNEKYEAGSAATVIIVSVVAFFGIIFFVGILAAISVPAYQDYTLRVKVVAADAEAEVLRRRVAEYAETTGALPATAMDVAVPDPIEILNLGRAGVADNGVVVIEFDAGLKNTLAGKTIVYVPSLREGITTWECRGSLPPKLQPRHCRSAQP